MFFSFVCFCRYNDTNLLVGSDSGHVEVWSLVSPGNELENNNLLDLYHDGMVLCISITCDGENGRCILSGGGDGRYYTRWCVIIIINTIHNGHH